MNTSAASFLIAACLVLGACSHPKKAAVVNEPQPKPAAASKRSHPSAETDKLPTPSKPTFGLREPDVVSELPDSGTQPPPPGGKTPATGNPGTVIVRPPR